MKRKSVQRILYTLLAVSFGLLIVVGLTYFGDKGLGPTGDILKRAGSTIDRLEQGIVSRSRDDMRRQRLQWLLPYRSNFDRLANPDTVLLGVYDNLHKLSFEPILSFEDDLGYDMPIIHIYTAWGGKPEQVFPALQVQAILQLGSIPMITWEPWLTDFAVDEYPRTRLENPDKNGMSAIANGQYDAYLEEWAGEAASIGSTLFLRFGHEMNDPYRYPWGPQHNRPGEFTAAWQHVWNIFGKMGADNVIWIWSPHQAYGYFLEYYPGGEYVDWVGCGTLNYGNVASWSQWWTFDQILGNAYPELSSFGKPMMITEFGCLETGGTRHEWIANALEDIDRSYPAIKSLVFFNHSNDHSTTYKSLDWNISNDSLSLKAAGNGISKWLSPNSN